MLLLAAVLVSVWVAEGASRVAVPWIPQIGVAFQLRLDGLSFVLALVALVVGAVIMLYSSSYVRQRRPTGFFTLMTAFAAAMVTLVLADDLVVLFVAWELTTLCSYLLIVRSSPEAGRPATRTLLVTAAGGLSLLAAVAFIAIRTGTTDLSAALTDPLWSQDPSFAAVCAVLVAVAAMTKSAQFPFHSWLPDAMVAPAPVSAYLHAATMVKAGIFLLLLFAPATSQSPVWSVLLVSVGLVTALLGGVFALQRTDIKELLAYSTVSQLGLLVAVIGLGTVTALTAAVLHLIAHALFKSAGFMLVGLVERRTGTRDLRELSGLVRAMPWDKAMLVLAALSMAGVFPTLGFVSKELLIEAFLLGPGGPAVVVLTTSAVVLSAILTVAYSARVVVATMFGPPVAVLSRWRDSAPMSVAIAAPAVAGIVLGPGVVLLEPLVVPAVTGISSATADEVPGLYLWHGVNLALVLSTVAIVLGVLLVTVGRPVLERVLVHRQLLPWTGSGAVQVSHDAIISLGRRTGDLTRSDVPARQLAVPVVLLGVATVGLVSLWRGLPATATAAVDVVDLGLLLVLVLGVVVAITAGTRLTAVLGAGVTGFGVVLWYLVLGASDVALTQLLVEVLTVVAMVLVLRRMSRRLPRPGRRRRSAAAAIAAVAAGAAATLATLIFTGHRPLSEVGRYFQTQAQTDTGGTNVVNTILVDYRALDTLGELVVLAIGAVAISALLDARPLVERPSPQLAGPLRDPERNARFLTTTDRALIPAMVAISIYLLLRGHNAPGGGFIAALVGASALVLTYLSSGTDEVPRVQRPYLTIAAVGVLIAVGTGLLGLFDGSFLRPLHAEVLGVKVTTALVFDVGVYLAVLGMVLAAVVRVGTPPRRLAGPGHSAHQDTGLGERRSIVGRVER